MEVSDRERYPAIGVETADFVAGGRVVRNAAEAPVCAAADGSNDRGLGRLFDVSDQLRKCHTGAGTSEGPHTSIP